MRSVLMICIVCTLTLANCTTTQYTQGHFLVHEQIKTLEVGYTTEAQVLKNLGTPQFKSLFGNTTWYYLGIKKIGICSFRPKITNYKIYGLSFNTEGVLTHVSYIDQNERIAINMNQDTTPTAEKSSPIFQKLFGNLGVVLPAGSSSN